MPNDNPSLATRRNLDRKGLLFAVALVLCSACEGEPQAPASGELPGDDSHVSASGELVLDWNLMAFEVAVQEHDYADPFLHLRALTMMHLAMHDAVNGVSSKYGSYASALSDESADPRIAAAAAAHGVHS